MRFHAAPFAILTAVLLAAGLVSACESSPSLSPDFGSAVKQDLAAQVANPDARYKGDPDPGSDGARVALAQARYQTDKVISPASADASGIGAPTTAGASAAAAAP